MTDFRVNVAAASIILALAAGALSPASAQSGPPVRLVPGESHPAPPDERPESDPGEGGGQREDRGRIGIVEEPLGEINAESAGVLDGASGGLGTDLWRGLGRDRLSGLIVQLPAHPKSAALRDLARRALLSRAVTPAGAAAGRSLVAMRMERLLAMGDLPGVRALAQAVPPDAAGNGLGAVEVEGLFLAGDGEAACAAARRHLEASDAPGLQIALVACQAIAGEHDKASLGLALLREQDARVPPTFVDLLQVLSGTLKSPIKSMPDPDGAQLALLAAAKRPVPGDAVKTQDAAELRAIAYAPVADEEVRVAAAERAGAFGALSPAELAEIYERTKLPRANLADALVQARQSYTTLNRALLYQAVRAETDPEKRALLVQDALILARERNDYVPMARILAPLIAELRPGAALQFFAADAARALYLAGDTEHATEWYRLLRDQEGGSEAAIMLWPVAHLAAGGTARIAWEPALLERWKEVAERDHGRAAAREQLLRYYALMTGLGETPGHETDWARLIGPETIAWINAVAPGEWEPMRLAAGANRRGETVLLAVSGVGETPLENLGTGGLRHIVASLMAVGLAREARAFALEAALAAGI